jgi:hypothetical protein
LQQPARQRFTRTWFDFDQVSVMLAKSQPSFGELGQIVAEFVRTWSYSVLDRLFQTGL